MLRRAVVILGLLAVSLTSARAQSERICPVPGPCPLLKQSKAVFVGTLIDKSPDRLHFRVTEAFKGVKGDYFDLEPLVALGIGDKYFSPGEQYVLFVAAIDFGDGEHLFAPQCSLTRALKYAHGILRQLRAEKSGKRVASVYGTLLRTLQLDIGIWDEDYVRPLPNVIVRLQSGKKSFETKTDEHGAYAFDRLPAGTYQASADLPPDLAVAQQISKDPMPPFDLPPRSCYAYDITALPTGRISGKVVAPDGNPLRSTSVGLYRVDRYKNGEAGLYANQDNGKPFEFVHLPGGDYILVFNRANQADPDAPFPRTFYPNAADLQGSVPIHLADGQQILNADIHVSNGLPTRELTVQLGWGGKQRSDYYSPQIIIEASEGKAPYAYRTAQDSYALNLLLSARYTIRAEAICQMGTKGKTATGVISVDGRDPSVSKVTFTFAKGECVRK
jgi:hypothetical protein